jgi:hypothetical protein
MKDLKTRPPGEKLKSLVAEYRPGQKKNSKIHDVSFFNDQDDVLTDQLHTTAHSHINTIDKSKKNKVKQPSSGILNLELDSGSFEIENENFSTKSAKSSAEPLLANDVYSSQPTTVVQQTYNKPTLQTTTVVQQTYNKPTLQPTTVVQQTYNKPTLQPTTVVQQEPTTVVQQDLQQTYNNKNTAVVRLCGIGLNILNSLFSISLTNGNRITGPISIESITSLAKVKGTKTTQTVIYRLEKDGFIKRDSFKAGRGGWTSYEIPNDVYNQLLKLTTVVQQNLQQTYNKPTSQLTLQPTTNPSSKIDSNNLNNISLVDLKNTTAFEKEANWIKSLDFSPVAPIGAMQVNPSIRLLVQEKLQQEQVQDFLNRFKNWLATQQKIQNPLAIFCNKLKEFAIEGDSAVLGMMTDQEREIEVKFIEETKKAREQIQLIEKAKVENSRSQEEKLKAEAEVEFEEWYKSASDFELSEMAAPIDLAPLRSNLHKISTKVVFMKRIGFDKQK